VTLKKSQELPTTGLIVNPPVRLSGQARLARGRPACANLDAALVSPDRDDMTTTVPSQETLKRIARSCICFQTRMTAHAVTRAYNRALAPLGLEVTQFNILAALASGQVRSVTALSDLLALDRTTMTRNLKRLEAAGLAGVTSGAGRAVKPELTAAGQEILAAAIPLWEAEHARMEGAVGAALWHDTREGLRAIRKSLKAREA
jgi:DNA-binding MarR family transcriptional regulator